MRLIDKQELQAPSSDRGTGPTFSLTPDEGQMIATLLKLRNWQNTIYRLSTHLGITKENSGSFPLKFLLADRIRSTAGKQATHDLKPFQKWWWTCWLHFKRLCSSAQEVSNYLLVNVFQHPEGTCCYHQWSLLFLNFLCRNVGGQANINSHQHSHPGQEAGYRVSGKRLPWP